MLPQYNTQLSSDNPRGGVNVHFDLASDAPLQQSPEWRIRGRILRFLHLVGGQSEQYPWHGWQGGNDDRPGQGYDAVLAFEINPACIEPRL